jgi:hypothetical protein
MPEIDRKLVFEVLSGSAGQVRISLVACFDWHGQVLSELNEGLDYFLDLFGVAQISSGLMVLPFASGQQI